MIESGWKSLPPDTAAFCPVIWPLSRSSGPGMQRPKASTWYWSYHPGRLPKPEVTCVVLVPKLVFFRDQTWWSFHGGEWNPTITVLQCYTRAWWTSGSSPPLGESSSSLREMRKLSPTCDNNDRYGIIMIVPKNCPIILIDDYHWLSLYLSLYQKHHPSQLGFDVRRTADRKHDFFGLTWKNHHIRVLFLGRTRQDRQMCGIWVGSTDVDRKPEVKQRKDVDQQQCSSQWSLVQWQPQIDKPWSTNYVWEVLPNTHNLLKWYPQKKLGPK